MATIDRKKNGKVKINFAGRPFKLTDPVEVRKRLANYFETVPQQRWTITGVALELDIDRDTIVSYRHGRVDPERVPDEVVRLIKKAYDLVHMSYEDALRGNGRAGEIFALKNFGWTDRQEHEHSGEMSWNVVNYSK